MTKKVTELIHEDVQDKVESDWNYEDFEENAP